MGKPRSINQRGSARTRRDGRIELRAYAGRHPTTGRDHYLTDYLPAGTPDREVARRLTDLVGRADTLAAARRARRRGEPAAPDPTPVEAGRTIGQALEAWWSAHARHLASADTVRTYLDAYLIPGVGAVPLVVARATVDPDEAAADPDLFNLADWFDHLRGVGRPGQPGGGHLAPATKHKLRGYLSAAFTQELRRPGTPLAANPCAGLSLPRIEDRESTTPEPDELAAFLPFLAGHTRRRAAHTVTRRRGDGTPYTFVMPERHDDAYQRVGRTLLAFALLVASGPRPQEVAALTRGQFDRTTGRLELLGDGVVSGKVRRGETTKRRRRTIRLDARLVDALDAHLAAQDEAALGCGVRLGRRAYIFSSVPDGSTPVAPGTPSQTFDRTVEAAVRAGIPVPPGMRLYDMRHYGITQLLRAGTDVARVAQRYGTSARMIHDRYAHAIPGNDDGLADTLAAAWGDPTAPAGDVVAFPG